MTNNNFALLQREAQMPLPAPVDRYLKHVLPADCAPIRSARFRQKGELRSSPQSERWMKFSACQSVSPTQLEFVWDARVSVFPLLHVRVIDSLQDTRGAGQVLLMSLIRIANVADVTEMNSGALHRFLAEAVWYPTALQPNEFLSWDPIDEHRALATLAIGNLSVSLEFRFNQSNEIVGIYTPGRWGSFEGGFQQAPWEGSFRDYVRYDGVLIPSAGEVGWYIDGLWHSVWRGKLTQANLNF